MKKFISASLFLAASVASVHAEEVFVAGDASALTAVCVAALDSYDAASSKAAELGIGRQDFADLACNGAPLARFAKTLPAPVAPNYMVVKTSDASPVSELCAAAITSPTKFEEIRETHFNEIADLELSIQCNNMSLRSFMQKYRSRVLTAAL